MPEQQIDPNEEGRKGGATASSVRVYDQPKRSGMPLARIVPIVLALAVLGYLLMRAMNRPAPEPVQQQPSVQQSERSAPSDGTNPPGPRASEGRSGTANPPGPAGGR